MTVGVGTGPNLTLRPQRRQSCRDVAAAAADPSIPASRNRPLSILWHECSRGILPRLLRSIVIRYVARPITPSRGGPQLKISTWARQKSAERRRLLAALCVADVIITSFRDASHSS